MQRKWPICHEQQGPTFWPELSTRSPAEPRPERRCCRKIPTTFLRAKSKQETRPICEFSLCPFCVFRRWDQSWELLLGGFQVSEIAIPHFLTASIFSAQGADLTVFHRNVRLLVLLCVISGICRSKSCMV